MAERIFLSPPHLGPTEADLIRRAVATNYIAPVGPDLAAFEAGMADYLGAPCTALSSGTAALHLALLIAGVEPGDTVLCSDLTFVASVNPVLYVDAEPVFVDAEPDTWNMDPDRMEAFLVNCPEHELPTACIVTHLYGNPAPMARIAALCAEFGITIIEDAAESLGATYPCPDGPCPTGTMGRFGALSFNGNKVLTTSGGGMLVCRDQADAERARFLATQARDPAPHYEHSELGYSYRLSNLCAAIGRGQLAVLPERVARKREIYDAYAERLADVDRLLLGPEEDAGCASNRWLTCALMMDEDEKQAARVRDGVIAALEAGNIEARPLWKPMHMQPLYEGTRVLGGEVGRELFARGFCLPSGTALTEEQIDRVCAIVRTALETGTRS